MNLLNAQRLTLIKTLTQQAMDRAKLQRVEIPLSMNKGLDLRKPPGLFFALPSRSEQEITLGHRQHIRRFAPQQNAVSLDLISLRIDLDVWQVVVVDQVGFLHLAATFDHGDFLFQAQGFAQARPPAPPG